MSACFKCKAALEAGANFCESCGAEQPQIVFCEHCGEKLESGATFCDACGQQVEGTREETPEKKEQEAKPREETQRQEAAEQNKAQQESASTITGIKDNKALIYRKLSFNIDGKEVLFENKTLNCLLYVDNQLIDKQVAISAKSLIVVLETRYRFSSGEKFIQAYAKEAGLTVKFKICVDGNFVCGDNI